MLVDVAITGDRNVVKKVTEKVLNYKDLIIDIRRMWNVTAKVILVIIGSEWNHFEIIKKYLSNIPGKHEITGLQTYRTITVYTVVFLKMNPSVRNM